MLVFGSNGRVYSVPVATLPGARGDGQPITTLIDLEAGSRVAHFFAGSATALLLLASSGGYGLLARSGDLAARNRGGKAFVALQGNETLLAPAVVAPAAAHVAVPRG